MNIDVVIPVYNPGPYLEESLQSVLNQTYTGTVNIIVVDDGSTEDVGKIVGKIKDPSISYIRLPENKGSGYARNQGILHGRSEIIAFHDADDIMMPYRLASVAKVFSDEPHLMLVAGNYQWLYNDCFLFDSQTTTTLTRERLFVDFPILMCATAICRKALPVTGLFNERYEVFEDYDLWRKFFKYFPNQVKYVDEVWFRYRRNTDRPSLMQQYQKKIRRLEILQEIFLQEEKDIPGLIAFLEQEHIKKKQILENLFL